MRIQDIFATAIEQRIEPVVKVAERSPQIVLNEIQQLVVTPQWERYLRTFLDSYAEASDRDNEQSIGVWVSGFFGSGKSLFVKILGRCWKIRSLVLTQPMISFLSDCLRIVRIGRLSLAI